jgi:two-component system phosphate regulon sensor histidine kinase PhoR
MAKGMAEGELDQRIQVTSRDELGELMRAFNHMAAKLKDMVSLITIERDKMTAILSNMADGILITGREGKITMVNQAAEKILHLSRDKMVGQSFIEVVRDHEVHSIWQKCLKTGAQQTGLVEMVPRRQFLGVVATPVGREAGSLVLFQDLSELRRLETARRDLISNISHDLRTPIASVKALAETLQEGAIDDQAVVKEFLNRINAEADRLVQMVQELGELSRIESGGVSFKVEPVDLNEAIKRTRERLRIQAERAGLDLILDIPSTLPLALADEERVEQVLVNLVDNALKFTPPGGKVALSAKVEDANILISVVDTGVGISADDLPRIFERFYKADKARAGEGTGLGLAIAKHIVEALGGKIWAESIEGRGSTFTFTLPIAAKP